MALSIFIPQVRSTRPRLHIVAARYHSIRDHPELLEPGSNHLHSPIRLQNRTPVGLSVYARRVRHLRTELRIRDLECFRNLREVEDLFANAAELQILVKLSELPVSLFRMLFLFTSPARSRSAPQGSG